MRLFDTHCHFEHADPTEVAAVLSRAKAAGVERLMAVGGSPALNEAAALAVEVAAEAFVAPQVCCAVGLDREQAGKAGDAGEDFRRETEDARGEDFRRETEDLRGLETLDERRGLRSNVSRPSPVSRLASNVSRPSPVSRLASNVSCPSPAAIGEIGLDYHYSPETRDAQLKLFAEQLEEARRRDLPVVIHTREAAADTVSLLREIPSRGIIHCFTGTPDEARAYLDLGFYISISGIVTFKPADNVRESALVVPDDRILIETDAPFLAPVPLRGQPNEPAFIVHTCEFLAKLRGIAAEDFAELTFANAERALGNVEM